MKIFHPLLCYYPSQAGGPANTLYWLNTALDKAQFETKVISSNFGLENKASLEAIGQNISTAHHKVQFLDSGGTAFVKKGLTAVKQSDIIQFSSLFFPPTLPLLVKAVIQKKKVIISPRGELYSAALSIKSKKKKIWLQLIKVFQSKIHFHATNEFEKGIIQKYFPKAAGVALIPNYIKMPKKQPLDIVENQLLFIGRINPIKNIDVLIKAIDKAQKTLGREVKLVIAGSARLPYEIAYENKLKHLVKDLELQKSVTFLGHVQGEDKDKLIARSYALVLPSESENFGNVVLEALAQGTPVIASKNTPWESLEKTNSGFWVLPSVDELSKTIVGFLDMSDAEYKEIRKNAYRLCSEKFDIGSNSNVWADFYKEIN
ncbi:glycosyltransferase [Mesonia ostreae]|uniref:Glycosyltransferase n=1 Tax=Mesonia ostreae TaxID=861110 RepID=A0ABU2KH50_9FLAO|nr:glycosyltransferase [Mesonia ostreae]MDT0294041.1 glycosyltransferase [Mesonia ostreae]